MKPTPRTLAALLLAAATFLVAAPSAPPPPLDVRALLSGPPTDASTTARELEIVLARQASRTPADVQRIKHEGTVSPFLFRDVVGDWFTEANLPLTTAVLKEAGDGVFQTAEAAKKLWTRNRPPLVDPRVVPCVGLPANSSYPSSHGACGVLWGALLGQLDPDRADLFRQRGLQIGDDRVTGGVHFPSDIEAGRTIGRAWLARLLADPAFQTRLQAARQEFQRVRSAAMSRPAGAAPAAR